MKPIRDRSRIIFNKKISKNIRMLRLKSGKISSCAGPGQFVHVYCGGDTFLRRPFAIFAKGRGTIDIIYKVRGRGTAILGRMGAGEVLDVMGPLGNGFRDDAYIYPMIVAGGTGVAPLHFLASTRKAKGIFLYGIACGDDDVSISDIKRNGYRLFKVCEKKDKKKVTDLMPRYIKRSDIVFASGPVKMLKKVAEICSKEGKEGYVSWEERMGCGIGLCQACVVKTVGGYKKVCEDGPVFGMDEIDWSAV